MLLHHNDFPIWRSDGKMVVAKFRIVGEVVKEDERILRIPRPKFWDTSKGPDPTRRILTAVQFQFYKVMPEELTTCEVNVSASNGSLIKDCREFQDENGYIIEYLDYCPMVVVVKNYLIKKLIRFEVRWDRRPNQIPGEYIFYLRLGQYSEPLHIN